MAATTTPRGIPMLRLSDRVPQRERGRMRGVATLSMIGGLALGLARPAAAQTAQAVSIQGSLLYAGLFGSAYSSFDPGLGFEAQIRYTATSGFSYGAGYQRTSHNISGYAGGATLSGPFFEPRYTFEIKGHDAVFPYASLRASSLKQSVSVPGFNSSASGFTANVGGGFLLRLTDRSNLDFGATYGLTHFSDFVAVDQVTGQRGQGTTGSGSNFVLRFGLAIGLF